MEKEHQLPDRMTATLMGQAIKASVSSRKAKSAAEAEALLIACAEANAALIEHYLEIDRVMPEYFSQAQNTIRYLRSI